MRTAMRINMQDLFYFNGYMKKLNVFILILFAPVFLRAGVISQNNVHADFIVDVNGSGDFKTIQEAINAVADYRKKETVIYIKKGTYKEKLVLPASKNNVTFIGEDRDQTIITYDDYASKKNAFGEEMGTTGSSGFFIFGDEFRADNITFENSSGPVGQAVAVRVDGDKAIFRNCRFLGNQDTLYLHGSRSRQYYKNCYIEGTVDFIFGWSVAVFDQCDIFCKDAGYITAASTDQTSEYGFVFLNCRITGNGEAGSFFLGRPWRPWANVVYLNCFLDKQIKKEGWSNWGDPEKEKTTFYAEYQNFGPGAVPGSRISWSRQLTNEEALRYTVPKIFSAASVSPAFNSDWVPVFEKDE